MTKKPGKREVRRRLFMRECIVELEATGAAFSLQCPPLGSNPAMNFGFERSRGGVSP